MQKQPLVTTVLKAPRSLKNARFIAETLALEIDVQYQNSRPDRAGKSIAKFKETEDGFTLYVPMKNDAGEWKNCPVYRWTKGPAGAKLEYDPRVVTIS